MKKYYGKFGGQFVPNEVKIALDEVEKAFLELKNDKEFKQELQYLLKTYVGRPTPLYHAKNLSKHYKHEIYLKREDLTHTGAIKSTML